MASYRRRRASSDKIAYANAISWNLVCASDLSWCLSGCHRSASLRYAVRISEQVAVVGTERTVYGFISVGGEERSSTGSVAWDLDFLEEDLDFEGIVEVAPKARRIALTINNYSHVLGFMPKDITPISTGS